MLPRRFRRASTVLSHCFQWASTPPAPTLYPSAALSRLSLGLPWNFLPLRFPLASHRLRFLRDLLADYLEKVGLAKNQTKRYVEGKSSWKVGQGRGRNLKAKQDWDHKPGGRGGVPPVFVKVAVLREVFTKHHGQR